MAVPIGENLHTGLITIHAFIHNILQWVRQLNLFDQIGKKYNELIYNVY